MNKQFLIIFECLPGSVTGCIPGFLFLGLWFSMGVVSQSPSLSPRIVLPFDLMIYYEIYFSEWFIRYSYFSFLFIQNWLYLQNHSYETKLKQTTKSCSWLQFDSFCLKYISNQFRSCATIVQFMPHSTNTRCLLQQKQKRLQNLQLLFRDLVLNRRRFKSFLKPGELHSCLLLLYTKSFVLIIFLGL